MLASYAYRACSQWVRLLVVPTPPNRASCFLRQTGDRANSLMREQRAGSARRPIGVDRDTPVTEVDSVSAADCGSWSAAPAARSSAAADRSVATPRPMGWGRTSGVRASAWHPNLVHPHLPVW